MEFEFEGSGKKAGTGGLAKLGARDHVAQGGVWACPEARSHLILGTNWSFLSWKPDLGCGQEWGLSSRAFRKCSPLSLLHWSCNAPSPVGALPSAGQETPCRLACRLSATAEAHSHRPGWAPGQTQHCL